MRSFATITTALLVFALLPGIALGEALRVAIPAGGTVAASESISWRDAGGRRGSGTELATAGLTPPIRLRGADRARSGGRTFPLPLELRAYNGALYAVIDVNMNDYLAGVLPHEMNVNWPDEALKAQAVLARTFALRRKRERSGRLPYDVVAGTVDQEYRWSPSVPQRLRKLVRATSGEVMRTPSGSLAQVFYHSCSGGMTADAGEIWSNSVPGIVPVKDPNDTICPDYFWTHRISPQALGGILDMGPVVEVDIQARGPSGRVTKMRVSDDRTPKSISGVDFRKAVGAGKIKSTLFQVRVADSNGQPEWMVQGSGSGHGVGMSQFGAKALAETGASYREILSFYFPRLRLDR